MQALSIGDMTVHYRLMSAPSDRPAVVFANSLGTDLRIWDTVADRLAGDFTMLFYDKRGHGLSDTGTPPYTMPDLAGDLAALMDGLSIRDAVVCGISVGGMIAQTLSAARPELVRALVLCDTGVRIGTDEMWNARIAAVEGNGLAAIADSILERWFTPAFRAGDPAFPVWRNMLIRTPPDGYAGVCAALRDTDLTESARAIDRPTLCIVGDVDGSTPPDVVRHMADLIPGAELLEIAGAAHLPNIEQPDVVAAAIADFVARKVSTP